MRALLVDVRPRQRARDRTPFIESARDLTLPDVLNRVWLLGRSVTYLIGTGMRERNSGRNSSSGFKAD